MPRRHDHRRPRGRSRPGRCRSHGRRLRGRRGATGGDRCHDAHGTHDAGRYANRGGLRDGRHRGRLERRRDVWRRGRLGSRRVRGALLRGRGGLSDCRLRRRCCDRVDRHREQRVRLRRRGGDGRSRNGGRHRSGGGRDRIGCGGRRRRGIGRCRRGRRDRRGVRGGGRCGRIDGRALDRGRGSRSLGGRRPGDGRIGGRRRWGIRRGRRSGSLDGHRIRNCDHHGRRRWRRRWLRRGRVRGRADRQEHERVEVTLRVGGEPDAEVDRAAASRGSDRLALAYRGAAPDRERAEVQERHRVAVRCEDRQRRAAARDGAGERDAPRCRREDRLPGRRADVDATVLAAGIRVSSVEDEGAHHVPARGPGPCPSPGHGEEQERRCEQDDAAQGEPPCCRI
jgi:hypothetical protein